LRFKKARRQALKCLRPQHAGTRSTLKPKCYKSMGAAE
jgi:hypothetical protein